MGERLWTAAGGGVVHTREAKVMASTSSSVRDPSLAKWAMFMGDEQELVPNW